MTFSECEIAPIRLFDTRGANLLRFAIPGPADNLTHTVTVGPVSGGMMLAPIQAPDVANRDQSR